MALNRIIIPIARSAHDADIKQEYTITPHAAKSLFRNH